MKITIKTLGAVVVAGVIFAGCENGGLVKLENKSPQRDQAVYEKLLAAVQEKADKNNFDIYHISSIENESKASYAFKNKVRLVSTDEYNLYVMGVHKENKNLKVVISAFCQKSDKCKVAYARKNIIPLQ